ncbi:hypothetical protein, partial [Azospirillum doebereinerae]|uniref:hypothetical protein n=1 Tax=Azospirillum doebereinerae TaxID=92933 RepID=UPI003D25A2FE
TVCLLQLWMRTDVRVLCRSHSRTGTKRSNGENLTAACASLLDFTINNVKDPCLDDVDEPSTGEPDDECPSVWRSEARKPTGSRWQAIFLAVCPERVKPFFPSSSPMPRRSPS